MIQFQCDYEEGACPQILERLVETNLEQTIGYSEDEYCKQAREKIKKACDAPEADVHFLVGGTQTNYVVIRSILRPYQGVISAVTGHINVHETGAVEATGHKVLVLPSKDGKITASQVRAYYDVHWNDADHEHIVQPGMVYISHPTEYGSLYTLSEVEAIRAVCNTYGLPLYIDGARLGYALAAKENELTLQDLARLSDAFYIGGTKVGALLGEAIVFPKGMDKLFPTHAKRQGAMLAKGFVPAIQFSELFTDHLYERLGRHGIDMAMELKKGLLEKGYALHIDSYTNQQFVILPEKVVQALRENVDFEVWERKDEDTLVVRFVTSWSTKKEDVEKLLSLL